MLTDSTEIRVRYGETDKMGVVYYGSYALYYEVGRTDLMRKYGITYKNLEDQGIQLPVINMETEYIKSAFYDDIIRVNTFVKERPLARLKFYYEILNSENQIINKATTTLIFFDAILKKPMRAPKEFLDKVSIYF
jgi:acyl-CoA thioester hydrolase